MQSTLGRKWSWRRFGVSEQGYLQDTSETKERGIQMGEETNDTVGSTGANGPRVDKLRCRYHEWEQIWARD